MGKAFDNCTDRELSLRESVGCLALERKIQVERGWVGEISVACSL